MGDILPSYDVNDATWLYLSLPLIVAVFFRFGRVWSLRNLDLALLLCMSPGLLLVSRHPEFGYAWLFAIMGLLLTRLFCDGLFTRRSRTEQNLNAAGLAFLCISSFAFLMTSVATKPPPPETIETVRRGEQLLNREAPASAEEKPPAGPASSMLAAAVGASSKAVAAGNGAAPPQAGGIELTSARIMAILAHSAVVVGLLLVGCWHFGELHLGLAMATLYLLLPCTSYDVADVIHVLPAALIVWAFVAYRRPMIAGSLMGLACGTLFFPIFLLPLWAAFYGRRNALRFGTALALVAALLIGSLAFTSADAHSLWQQTFRSIDFSALMFRGGGGNGYWSTHDPTYRIPVFVAFVVMLVVLMIWPRKKNLEHLMAHSTAVVIGTQFWYQQQGGVYLLWYLPLLLLVVFRPRLTQLQPPESPNADERTKSVPKPKQLELAASRSAGGTPLFR